MTRLADLTESQQAAIRRIHSEKDAVNEPLAATRPNAIFTGRERFEAEQAAIFQKHAVPIAIAAVLAAVIAVTVAVCVNSRGFRMEWTLCVKERAIQSLYR